MKKILSAILVILMAASIAPIVSAQGISLGKAPNPQADLNGDGVVDEHDLNILLALWGPRPLTFAEASYNSPDVNGDGIVDAADLAQILGSWGFCDGDCPADLNGDGEVEGDDIKIVEAYWGWEGEVPPFGNPDFDGNGTVNARDLAILLGSWGPLDDGGESSLPPAKKGLGKKIRDAMKNFGTKVNRAWKGVSNQKVEVSTSTSIVEGEKFVTICHVPGGNVEARHSITIGRPAVETHLAHGDYLGECETVSIDNDPADEVEDDSSDDNDEESDDTEEDEEDDSEDEEKDGSSDDSSDDEDDDDSDDSDDSSDDNDEESDDTEEDEEDDSEDEEKDGSSDDSSDDEDENDFVSLTQFASVDKSTSEEKKASKPSLTKSNE